MSVDSVKQKNISKTLTLWNFFTIGFGAIIGTGWIFLVGEWIIISGGPIPAMLAFLLGALLLLPIEAVFGELTSALPIDGGVIEYVDRTYGKTVSFITGWLLLLSNIIMCPWETIAVSTLFGTLFGDMFPWLRSIRLYSILGADVYLFPVLIALCLSGFIIRQNSTVLRKKVGMVFQQPNPFPMSIYDNIAYGPRVHGIKDKRYSTR